MSRLYSRRARTLVLRSAILKANISVKVRNCQWRNFSFLSFQCQAREQPEHGNFNNVPQWKTQEQWWWPINLSWESCGDLKWLFNHRSDNCNHHSLWYFLAATVPIVCPSLAIMSLPFHDSLVIIIVRENYSTTVAQLTSQFQSSDTGIRMAEDVWSTASEKPRVKARY